MRAIGLIIVVVTCAVPVRGRGYAIPSVALLQYQSSANSSSASSDQEHEARHDTAFEDGKDNVDAKPSDETRDGKHPSNKHRLAGRGALIRTNHPPFHGANNRRRLGPPDAANSRPGSNGSGLIQNDTTGPRPPVRPPNDIRALIPSPNTGRHRGANPAAINGSANVDRRGIATINGSRMNRKP